MHGLLSYNEENKNVIIVLPSHIFQISNENSFKVKKCFEIMTVMVHSKTEN